MCFILETPRKVRKLLTERDFQEREERECIGIKGYKGIMERKGINWWRAKKNNTGREK